MLSYMESDLLDLEMSYLLNFSKNDIPVCVTGLRFVKDDIWQSTIKCTKLEVFIYI